MRRFWTMLAHLHGQTWNAAELGRSMGLNDKTATDKENMTNNENKLLTVLNGMILDKN